MLQVLDLNGKIISELPRLIDPPALAAVVLLVERSFEESVQIWRELESET